MPKGRDSPSKPPMAVPVSSGGLGRNENNRHEI
jgi:hypothetical protein